MKKKHKIVIHGIALMILALFVVEYVEEIRTLKLDIYHGLKTITEQTQSTEYNYIDDVEPIVDNGEAWYQRCSLIHHAGGGIEGNTYTNSKEAVEQTLKENPGACAIEMDFLLTSDEVLVCAHRWKDSYWQCEETPTLEEFLSWKIQGKYTPLTAEMLIEIMAENPDMYLITDTKEVPDRSLKYVIGKLLDLCEGDQSLLDRIVVQIYYGEEKREIQESYPLKDSQFVITTYLHWKDFSPELALMCSTERIGVIATPTSRGVDAESMAMMKEKGYRFYVYTVNRIDEAQGEKARGVDGLYSDFLRPEDLNAAESIVSGSTEPSP